MGFHCRFFLLPVLDFDWHRSGGPDVPFTFIPGRGRGLVQAYIKGPGRAGAALPCLRTCPKAVDVHRFRPNLES